MDPGSTVLGILPHPGRGSVMGPVAGYLIERLGSRRMVLIGLLFLGGGLSAI